MKALFLAIPSAWMAPLLLALGILLRIVIKTRRAKRRGAGGLQQFRTVIGMLLIPVIEWLLWWAANGLIIYGLLGWVFAKP